MNILLVLLTCLFGSLVASGVDVAEFQAKRDAIDARIEVAANALKSANALGDEAKSRALNMQRLRLQAERDKLTLEIAKEVQRGKDAEGDTEESVIREFIKIEESLATCEKAIEEAKRIGLAEAEIQKLRETMVILEDTKNAMEEGAIYEAVFWDCYLTMEKRFPATKDKNSEFTKRLEAIIAVADEKTLANPRHLIRAAEGVSEILKAEAAAKKK